MAIDAKTISIYMQVTGPFAAQMGTNAAATQHFGNSAHAGFGKAQAGISRWAKVASTVGKVSAIAIAVGLALSAKAAIDFQTSFAGVRKTVEASEGTFQRLAEGVRQLALEIPIGVNELNRIMELGGQLGVDPGGLIEFTETIAKIGVTTTLSTDQAATDFARLDNIMQLGGKSFERIGSTIVGLGNNFAATEDEIISFALRIAPIGKTVGLTADEILSIATAFTSVGIPAERGGTALQKVFLRISDAALDGGEKLQTFADVTGMTIDQFQLLAETNPAQAFEAFIVGLEGVIKSGKSTTPIFESLNLSNERVRNSLLAMANASNVLTDALDQGQSFWERNIALSEEAAKRFETFASQAGLLKNQLIDMGIAIGQEILPALTSFIAGLSAVFDWIGSLPGPLLAVTGLVGGLAASMWALNAHPVIRALTIVAAAVFYIGTRAQQAEQRVKDLQAVLDKGFVDQVDLVNIVGQDVVDMFTDLGFGFEELRGVLTLNNEDFETWRSLSIAAIEDVNSAGFATSAGVDVIVDESVGAFIRARKELDEQEEETNAQAVRLLQLRTLGGLESFDFRGLEAVLLKRKGIIEKARFDKINLQAIYTKDSAEDAIARVEDFATGLREAFSEIEDAIRGQLDGLAGWDDEFEVAWDDIIETLNRQVGALEAFEQTIGELDLTPNQEALVRSLLPSFEAKELFNQLGREARDDWIDGVVEVSDRADVLVGVKFELDRRGLEDEFAKGLIDDMAEKVQKAFDENPTQDIAGLWLGQIEDTLSVYSTGPIKDAILRILTEALVNPGSTAIDLAAADIIRLLAAYATIPSVIKTMILVEWDISNMPIVEPVPPPLYPGTTRDPRPTDRQNAFGGNVFGNEPTIVGEYGKELFVPFSNGTIIPNSKLGGGDVAYNLNVYGSEDIADDGRVLLLTAQTLGSF